VPIPWPGHEAVVVFFVLSGYVIAFTASDSSVRLKTYVEHRAARILSVAVPALMLSVVVAPFAAGPSVQYAGPLELSAEQFWFASLVNVVFLGQSFGMSVTPPFNGPFWSICYEVWYYVIFAAWMYSGKRWRIALTALALAAAGLKIVILLPVWLMGVWLYHYLPKLTQRRAFFLFITSGILSFAFFWSGASHIIRGLLKASSPEFVASLSGSNQFIGDLVLGVFVTANFAAVASLGSYMRLLLAAEKKIRYAATFTLSTYLYHLPLSVFIWNGLGVRNAFGFLCIQTVLIITLGQITERRVRFYRRAFRFIFEAKVFGGHYGKSGRAL
jgi:peptidoglycan/LPS O-acetylase OafA/YrhL